MISMDLPNFKREKKKRKKKRNLKDLKRKKPASESARIPPKFFGNRKIMRRALKNIDVGKVPIRKSRLMNKLEKLPKKDIENYNEELNRIWEKKKQRRKDRIRKECSKEDISTIRERIKDKQIMIDRLKDRIDIAEGREERSKRIRRLKNDKKKDEQELKWMREILREKESKIK